MLADRHLALNVRDLQLLRGLELANTHLHFGLHLRDLGLLHWVGLFLLRRCRCLFVESLLELANVGHPHGGIITERLPVAGREFRACRVCRHRLNVLLSVWDQEREERDLRLKLGDVALLAIVAPVLQRLDRGCDVGTGVVSAHVNHCVNSVVLAVQRVNVSAAEHERVLHLREALVEHGARLVLQWHVALRSAIADQKRHAVVQEHRATAFVERRHELRHPIHRRLLRAR